MKLYLFFKVRKIQMRRLDWVCKDLECGASRAIFSLSTCQSCLEPEIMYIVDMSTYMFSNVISSCWFLRDDHISELGIRQLLQNVEF